MLAGATILHASTYMDFAASTHMEDVYIYEGGVRFRQYGLFGVYLRTLIQLINIL